MVKTKIRLYVDHPLAKGQTIPLDGAQSNYLFAVMRQQMGARISVFNGRDGEFEAEVTRAHKKAGALACLDQTRALLLPPDLWLLFAPIKKARTDFIVEKAAEMGARRIVPVATDFTNAERVRQDRLQAHAVEAAEQCGGTFVPDVAALTKLDQLLADWDETRQIMFCDETLAGAGEILGAARGEKWAILIGPEGGFSSAERDALHAHPCAHAVSLGPRILRADTAAVAALTVWQQHLGDWS